MKLDRPILVAIHYYYEDAEIMGKTDYACEIHIPSVWLLPNHRKVVEELDIRADRDWFKCAKCSTWRMVP